MNFKKSFGEKVKRLRKNRGFTQEQLAEMIDIDSRNLSRIEVGNSFVKAETIEKILTALDVTPEELFANDYIKDSKVLISEIYCFIEKIKNKPKKLEKIYKMIKFFVEED